MTVYLLTGLPCSGKTTHARTLETQGVIRVPVDDMMIAANGRLGVDYPPSEHLERLGPIFEGAISVVEDHLSGGRSVVLDHGLGRRDERDRLKRIAETHGAAWELLCFDADIQVLRERCRVRSRQAGTVPINDDALAFLAAMWDRPDGEGEESVCS